jgi:plasmid stabilization system protein ParE
MGELAIRDTYMADSAGRFGYTLQVHLYPSHVKQSYRARYARVRISRALHGEMRWQIWVSSAGIAPIRQPQSNPTERVMRELELREPCLAENAGRIGYPVQLLLYPTPAKQPYRARYARARISRALHGAKRWPIWLSSAGTHQSATRKATLPRALCDSSQFASPSWRKALAELDI